MKIDCDFEVLTVSVATGPFLEGLKRRIQRLTESESDMASSTRVPTLNAKYSLLRT